MNTSREDGEATELASTSKEGTGRRSTLLSSIKENNELGSPSTWPLEEAQAMDKQGIQNGSAPRRSPHGSVFDTEFEEEQYVRKPRSRKSSSSYAASTKASQARKNEKLEISSRPGGSRPRAFTGLDVSRISPIQRSHSTFKSSKGGSPASDFLPQMPWEQKDEDRQTRYRSPDPTDSQIADSYKDEDEAEILHYWMQKRKEAEEWLVPSENAGFEKERLEKRPKELETERDEALNIRGRLQQELEVTKNEVVNLRHHNAELEAKINESIVASVEREEQAKITQRVREEAENWKLKHDQLDLKIRELEEKAKERDRLESRLPLMEAVEVENKALVVMFTETQKELRKTQKELDQITEYAQEKDNEILESDKRLEMFQHFLYDTSEVMTKWVQASSIEPRVEISEMDGLIKSYSEDDDIKQFLVNTQELLKKFVHKQNILESRLEDKDYEIKNMKKGMEERIGEIEEVVQRTPGLMNSGFFTSALSTPGPSTSDSPTSGSMASGSTRPPGLLQHDREGFEGLYEEELEKRKAAEKKIQDISVAKKQQLRLQQAKKELESRLSKALEENDVLRKEAEEAKLEAELWRDESEQSKLELDKRNTEFQLCIDQNEQEKDQYIKYYHTEAQDPSRWEAVSLHKRLEEQEQAYQTLKQEFDRSKTTNARRQGEIASLEKKCMIQSKHISDVEQAIFHHEKLPMLPNLDDEDESEYGSGSQVDAFSPSSPLAPSTHRSRPAYRPRKPRYEYPNAIATRTAKLEAYRAELHARTEEELYDAIFKRPCMPVRRDKTAEDVIEKVRKWSFAGKYPPNMEEWSKIRSASVWERWQGEKWVAHVKEKRVVEVLKKRGLLENR